ncbi:MAG: hydrogenase maturation protease [Raoultibacter sp.]
MSPNASPQKRIAVFCVGNKLMLDEGIGPAVFEELMAVYEFPEQVMLFDVGCMGLNMLPHVRDFDYLVTVDAIDGTGAEPGTIFEFAPEDMARHSGAMQSLHDLKLVDLFDAAALVGYEAEGRCFGMQVENMSPAELTIGLTPRVYAALPMLIDTVLADLTHAGVTITTRETHEIVQQGWHHTMTVSSEISES